MAGSQEWFAEDAPEAVQSQLVNVMGQESGNVSEGSVYVASAPSLAQQGPESVVFEKAAAMDGQHLSSFYALDASGGQDSRFSELMVNVISVGGGGGGISSAVVQGLETPHSGPLSEYVAETEHENKQSIVSEILA